jgi:N,N'-diacetyllegionaminate synthase
MKTINIGKKFLGDNSPCFIMLEPGGTFQNIDEAKNMIKYSAEAGADAIKFQTFLPGDADRIMAKKDIKISYNTSEGKKQELVYDALKRRELTKDQWKELVDYSKSKKILFVTAPYFPETVDFLQELDIDAIKVSKGDINNVILINQISKTQLPVILDGREKFTDVEKAISICEKNNNTNIIIMHCPSGYPAENAGVHLRAINKIQTKYDYPIGFADHSVGGIMNFAAISFGVKMIEKTITIDNSLDQVEHYMSLELSELKKFVSNIRSIEEALGNPDIIFESRVSEDARRSLVAKYDIKKGTKITENLLEFRRPGNMGISVSEGFNILNEIVLVDIPKGSFLKWNMFNE